MDTFNRKVTKVDFSAKNDNKIDYKDIFTSESSKNKQQKIKKILELKK